ncbi:fructose-6-phosphate aldolase [Syntrophobacter fumaroxidans]|uniref:Probable transaldolase n=1 Tax=Syntrophobacter fumaroxidans (strain DSM 10017 / MPOB) TaxID=335543 RepID=TAL_SYNFM|nr:fructose-6-phosphate aldolase [Syntrophobacter fumaroxidans]A0LEA2.1 RecName: Full=Probable transaldolase [Syntrophobacter fumaroxidans MPOB]ABK15754.1 transaldolase [Syntrophobacter fumaroxidans MPOB]
MKFFIDTANLDEIKEAHSLGILDGVTTNPSLIAKEGIANREDFIRHIKTICELIQAPVSAEAVSTDAEKMIVEARSLAAIDPHVVVKIPMTIDGLKAVRQLSEEGIKTNVTLVFSPLQALMAAKAGATYISPFVGRLDDISADGMNLVEEILEIFSNYLFETEIIVASVRNPLHVLAAAKLGADIATIPFKVIDQLAHHPLTDLGVERFLKDWEKVEKQRV